MCRHRAESPRLGQADVCVRDQENGRFHAGILMQAGESDSASASAEPGQVQDQCVGQPVCGGAGLGEWQPGGGRRRRDSEDGFLWTTCPE